MNDLPLQLAARFPPERLLAIAESLRAFPSFARARGEDYALADRVIEERLVGDDLVARVRGTRVYAVRWSFSELGIDPVCSCPAGPLCKHAYAVGVRLMGAVAALDADPDPAIVRLLPAAWRRNRPRPPASLARPTPLAAAAGSRVDPRLRALRESDQPWLRLEAAEQLLWRLGLSQLEIAGAVLQEVAHEPDPDLRCWRLAHTVSVAIGRVPRLLAPWAGREDLAARAAESTRRIVVERLSKWAGTTEREPHHLRVVLGLERFDDRGTVRVTLEARHTGARARDERCTSRKLNQLQAELRRDARILTPPQARLLRVLTDNAMFGVFDLPGSPGYLGNEQLNLLLDRAAGLPFVAWREDLPLDLSLAAGAVGGDRVKLDGDDLRLVLECHARGDELHVGLALALPEGGTRPLDPTLLWRPERQLSTTHPTVALVDGTFHRVVEEPPPDIVQTLAELHGVPLRREDGPLLDRLAARYESVAHALRSLTRTHAARPAVLLDLRESDWLCVRVFAHTAGADWRPGAPLAESERLFEHTPEAGWAALDAAAAGALEAQVLDAAVAAGVPSSALAGEADVAPTPPGTRPVSAAGPAPWREVPEPAGVASALAWLEQLEAARGERRGPGGAAPNEPDAARGWWLRLNSRTAERLAELWQGRPRDVAWFGNRAARELLAGRRGVRARLSVESSGLDWFSVKAEWESEGLALTEADLAKLRASREPFVRLAGGWVRREEAATHDALADALADLGLEPDGREQRVSIWQLAHARPGSFEALAEAGAEGGTLATLARIRESLASFAGVPRVDVPAGLTGTLRPYQRDGLDFLAWNSSLGTGSVLADDMGLGKTVQALAWLLHLREKDPTSRPALVVCPASVAHNWAREAARFAPGLRVLVLGSGRERRMQLRELDAWDVVVTNYALLRRDIAHWREIELGAAVLDEAQNIKNPDAAVARAALELKARHRIALTGTPLENRALDLWSILAFVQPGYLGARARFVKRYDRPDAPPHLRRLLSARLRPVLLRRLKDQVERDLPARIEERLDCEMTPGQRKLYLAELVRARKLLGKVVEDPEGIARRRIIILSVLTRLRQICCHPALADGDRALGSGKFDALFELLEPLRAEGQKVLVFSQFVRCLELIGDSMKRRGVPYHVLTGATSTRVRGEVVQAFTEDPEPSAFLVSLKAGGTGLNLTAANHVVLFDPWWNPAVEAQAIDRTHRIGQTRSVVAYRLYAEGTVEERIAELQARKAALARDVLGEEGFARALTREDLEYLLAD